MNLEALLGELHPNGYTVAQEHDDEKRENRFVFRVHDRQLFADIAMVIGDTVHNLRSALDHFIAASVCYRGGDDTATAFPTWYKSQLLTPKKLESKIARLGCAKPALQQVVLSLEPWIGGTEEWLWLLSEMDNIDKHRLVITTAIGKTEVEEETSAPHAMFPVVFNPPELAKMFAPTSTFTMRWAMPAEQPLQDGTVLFTLPDQPPKVQRKITIITELTFREPAPVAGKEILPTLRNLADSTAYLIDALVPLA